VIRPTVVALALCVVSSAQSMPYVPLQQLNNSVIPVRQGCGLGRQLVDGICVSNTNVRATVRKCSSRKCAWWTAAVNRARDLPPHLARRDLRPSNLRPLPPRRVDWRAQAL